MGPIGRIGRMGPVSGASFQRVAGAIDPFGLTGTELPDAQI
jgi:hypothetical protein